MRLFGQKREVVCIAKAFALALISLLLIASVVYAAIATPAPYAVYQTNVYRNCIESNDQMWVIVGVIEYGSNPAEDAGEAFIVRVLSSDNTELNAVAPYPDIYDDGYAEFCVGILFTATEVTTENMTWGGNFTVELTGNPALGWVADDPPTTSNNIISSWSDSTDMTPRVRKIATDLEDDWGVTLTQVVGGVTQLTSDGEDYFERSIAGLRAICPALFSATVIVPEFDERTYTQAEATASEARWLESRCLLTLDGSAGLTVADIGKVVLGMTTGHTGTLSSYDEPTNRLWVSTTDTFTVAPDNTENINVDGVFCGAMTGNATLIKHLLDFTDLAISWGISRMWMTSVVWLVLCGFIVAYAAQRVESYRIGAFLLAILMAIGAFIGAMPFVVAPIMGFLCIVGFVYTIAWDKGQ